jgi:outer membrane protein TolC
MVAIAHADPVPPPPPKRTLPQLIDLVRRRAPTVWIAQAQLEVAKTQKLEAKLFWAPTGEANYGITGAPRIECRAPNNFGGEEPGDTPEIRAAKKAIRTRDCVTTVDPGNGQTVNTTNFNIGGIGMQFDFRINQPIFTFGKIENAIRAAGHGVDAYEHGVEVARREAELYVARAYWGLKMARATLATMQGARDELGPWIKKIEDDLDAPQPKFTTNDLQRVKLAMAALDIGIGTVDKGRAQAEGGLRALLGEESDVDDEELSPVEIVEHTVDYYQRESLTNRPELRQLDAGVQGLRSVARARMSEMFPDIGLVGTMLWRYAPSVEDGQSAFINRANVLMFGAFLGIRQPLDIGQRFGRWRHARADANMLDAQRMAAREGFNYEIRRVHAELTEARRRMKATEAGQKAARGWLNAVQQNIDLGTSEPRDLIDAARSYFELRVAFLQSIMDVNVSTAALRRASGVDVVR